jgi:hypothetical protein
MLLSGRIVIEMHIQDDGDVIIDIETDDGTGSEMDLVTAVGVLEMSKDSLLHAPEEEDD